LCLGFLFTTNTNAQEDTKKVVIIKKVEGADGKMTTERQEATGKDADALIKKMKEDGSLDGIDIEMEMDDSKKTKIIKKRVSKDISIDKTVKDGKEMTKYKIVTEDGGEKKVLVWDGDGEMPAEMKEILKDAEMETEHSDDGKMMKIIVEDEDEDHDYKSHDMHKEKNVIKLKKESPNKVALGIMIEDDSQGVVVSEIVENSVAQKSGIKSGDTVIKINDIHVFNTDMLLQTLSKFDKGDSAKVSVLRDGKEKKIKVQF
jgi:hypothetical protein